MTKNPKRIVTSEGQMDMFDMLKQEQAEQAHAAPGKRCISAQLNFAAKKSLKQAPKSREMIAEEMSFLTGQDVTIHMINSWAAESHPHRLPAEMVPAFCDATGCDAVAMVINDSLGKHVLPGVDALRSEIQKLDEEAKRVAKEKQKRVLFLRELEGEQ
jgi:hypothetical protein